MTPSARVAAIALALPAALVAWFSAHHHEYWRDETQAFLLARDTDGLAALLGALRYEGHPPLLHLTFDVARRLFDPPWSMAVVGGLGVWALLFGIHRFLGVMTRRSPWLCLALALALGATYTVAYELGVVVRGYGLGLGLATWGLACLIPRDRRASPARGHALLGLAALTSVHAACLAGGAAAAHAISCLARRRPRRALSALIFVPFAAIVLWVVRPHPDRAGFDRAPAPIEAARLPELGWGLLTQGLSGGSWWGFARSREVTEGAAFVVAVVVGLAALGLVFRPRRAEIATVLLALSLHAATLGYILVARYPGSYRHWVVFSMPFLVFALAWCLRRERPSGPLSKALSAARVGLAISLLPWLAREATGLHSALRADLRDEFSTTRRAALALPPGARVLAAIDYVATSIAYWRSDVRVFGTEAGGREITFIRWDAARLGPASSAMEVAARLCGEAPQGTFVLGALRGGPLTTCLSRGPAPRPLRERGERPSWSGVDEVVELAEVDCACVAAGGRRRGR